MPRTAAHPSILQPVLDRPDVGLAKGTLSPTGRRKRIVIAVDPPLFDRVAYLAAASGVPFAEAARQLLERGLQASGVKRALRSVQLLDNGEAAAPRARPGEAAADTGE